MIFWKQNDLDLAAVSDVDPAELDQLVALVKKSQGGNKNRAALPV